jgi:GNAT superfamily N-acetyltransferase
MRSRAWIRDGRLADLQAAFHVCLKTGDNGADGEPFYRDDPDALGRIYVEPYLLFAPDLALILEDDQGVGGYALAVFDSREFYDRYERELRPRLCKEFPDPTGEPSTWSRVEAVYHQYHHPDYFCPEPYADFPSHLHIDLLPRLQGKGYGRPMIEQLIQRLRDRRSPGVHLGMSAVNDRAYGFYLKLGFQELCRVGTGASGSIYLGMRLVA